MGGEGDVLYFDPFYFKDGKTPKPKYFIVLKITGSTTVLASLPSSLDYRPTTSSDAYGCIDVPEACFSCFVFKGGHPVATNGWAFPRDTFLYGQQIDEYEVAILHDIYPVAGLDYHIVGTLNDEAFRHLKQCFAESGSVKRRFRRLLTFD